MYEIRDENGFVYQRVKNPAVVYDKNNFVLLKIGEWEVMQEYFSEIQKAYREVGFDKVADDIYLMMLPKDQEEIDKVFKVTGYIKNLHEKYYIN